MKAVAYLPIAAFLAAVPDAAPAQYDPGSGRSVITTVQTMGAKEVWDALWVFGSCYAGSERSKALKFVETEPGSVEEARTYKKLFTNSDAPTTSTTASATSDTTSVCRRPRRAIPPRIPRPPSRSDAIGIARDICRAGSTPKITAVTRESPNRKSRTFPSIPISLARGIDVGAFETSSLLPQYATKSPSTLPIAVTTKLSVRN